MDWSKYTKLALSSDTEICGLFHGFGPVAVAGNITYADGSPICALPNWSDDPFDGNNFKHGA